MNNWDETHKFILPPESNFKDKNIIVENIISRINDVIVKYRLRNRTLTRDAFLRAYNRPSDFNTFFEFYADYMKKYSYKIEKTTFATHTTVMEKLKEYNANLHFDDMTADWLDFYYLY